MNPILIIILLFNNCCAMIGDTDEPDEIKDPREPRREIRVMPNHKIVENEIRRRCWTCFVDMHILLDPDCDESILASRNISGLRECPLPAFRYWLGGVAVIREELIKKHEKLSVLQAGLVLTTKSPKAVRDVSESRSIGNEWAKIERQKDLISRIVEDARALLVEAEVYCQLSSTQSRCEYHRQPTETHEVTCWGCFSCFK